MTITCPCKSTAPEEEIPVVSMPFAAVREEVESLQPNSAMINKSSQADANVYVRIRVVNRLGSKLYSQMNALLQSIFRVD